jgi:hypothetical protein
VADADADLLIADEVHHTAPVAVTRREYKLQSKSKAITAFKELAGRSHYIAAQPGTLCQSAVCTTKTRLSMMLSAGGNDGVAVLRVLCVACTL